MIQKNIFKKKSKLKSYLWILFFLPIFVFLYYFIDSKINTDNYFNIPTYDINYYVIPKDKGGKLVANTDKKSLHLNKSINKNKLYNSSELFYSIQFLVSSKYTDIITTLNKFINIDESIYKKEDFYVLALTSELGIDYFLLYKNFYTREDAYNYCRKYIHNINKCLIVNAQTFNN